MVRIVPIIALFLVSITADVTLGLWAQNTFHALNFLSDTELYFKSNLPGKINVYTGDYDNVHFTVNKSGSNPDYIRVYIHRDDAGQFNVSVYYEEVPEPSTTTTPTTSIETTETPSTATTEGNTPTTTSPEYTGIYTPTTDGGTASAQLAGFTNILISVLAVFGVVFIQDKRQCMVVLLLLGICFIPLLQIIQAQQPPSADIDIYIPRNLTLKNLITIRAPQASIKLSKHLFAEAAFNEAQFECLSGINSQQACPSCCNGQGQCFNNECHCGLGFNGSDCTTSTLNSTFQIYTNPLDPRLMAVFTPEGDEIIALGNKTAVGFNSTITEFIVNSTDGKQTFTKMDSQGRVESASDSDGNGMQVSWEDNDFASFEVVLGSEQLNLQIDLTTIGDADTNPPEEAEEFERRRKRSNAPFSDEQTRGESSCVYLSPKQDKDTIHTVTKRNSEGEETAVYVSVTKCGNPVNGAAVTVDVYNEYDEDTEDYSSKEVYTAQPTGNSGQYKFVIPSEPALSDSETVQDTCESIVSGVTLACKTYNLIKKFSKGKAEKALCAALATAGLALTKFPSTWNLIYKFCTAVFKGIGAFCKIVEEAAAAPVYNALTDQTSTSDLVCDAALEFIDNFINYFTNKLVLFKPKAIIQGEHVSGASITTELEKGQSTSLTIGQAHDSPIINDFYAVPNDPIPGKGYLVYLDVSCTVEPFTIITVVGSDEFNSSSICYAQSICMLQVRGASAGVTDQIIAMVSDPPESSNSITRFLYLVF